MGTSKWPKCCNAPRIKNLQELDIVFFISGGAPLSAEIARFFHACDLLVLEGYGLTESAAASCVNRIAVGGIHLRH